MSSAQTSFFDDLISAARENPLGAVLIGGGALWLLVGNEKIKTAASSARAAVSASADVGARDLRSAASGLRRTEAPPTAPEMDHEGSFNLGETSREAGRAASEATSGAADKIRERLDEGFAYARENLGNLANPVPAKEAFAKAQSSLADVFERRPLVLGAVGLAIGAAVASAFQTSDLENRWVGELSDDVKADLNRRAGAVSHTVREAADSIATELSDTGAEAVDQVKQAAMDAGDAAREKVK